MRFKRLYFYTVKQEKSNALKIMQPDGFARSFYDIGSKYMIKRSLLILNRERNFNLILDFN